MASPPPLPLPALKNKNVRGLREKRNIAFPASVAPKRSRLPGMRRHPAQLAAPRFRVQRPSRKPFHLDEQFILRKRLRHVPTRALLLPPVTVAWCRLRRDQNHRNVRVRALALQI